MKRRLVRAIPLIALLAVATVALAVLSACGTAKRTTADMTDNGGSVTVKQKGTLQVSVLANPKSGLKWTVVDDAGGILTQIGEPAVQQVSPNPNASGPEIALTQRQTFQFDAVKKGSGQLKMEYRRPGDTTTPPEQTYTLNVTVE